MTAPVACPDHERLSAFYDGELPPAERDAIAEHVEGCHACASGLADLATTSALLAGEDAPRPGEDLVRRLARASVASSGSRRPQGRWRRFAVAASLLVGAVLVGRLVVMQREAEAPSVAEMPRPVEERAIAGRAAGAPTAGEDVGFSDADRALDDRAAKATTRRDAAARREAPGTAPSEAEPAAPAEVAGERQAAPAREQGARQRGLAGARRLPAGAPATPEPAAEADSLGRSQPPGDAPASALREAEESPSAADTERFNEGLSRDEHAVVAAGQLVPCLHGAGTLAAETVQGITPGLHLPAWLWFLPEDGVGDGGVPTPAIVEAEYLLGADGSVDVLAVSGPPALASALGEALLLARGEPATCAGQPIEVLVRAAYVREADGWHGELLPADGQAGAPVEAGPAALGDETPSSRDR